METRTFKDLVVWQRAMQLVVVIYEVTKTLPSTEAYGLTSQMRRSAVSIPSNIAEGYRRHNIKEYLQFCGIAAGSAAELETQILIVNKVYPAVDCKDAQRLLTEVQKMLYVLNQKLKLNASR